MQVGFFLETLFQDTISNMDICTLSRKMTSFRQSENVILLYARSTFGVHSGVARVLCALGQEILLRPLSTKASEFKVKIRCKSAEESKT